MPANPEAIRMHDELVGSVNEVTEAIENKELPCEKNSTHHEISMFFAFLLSVLFLAWLWRRR